MQRSPVSLPIERRTPSADRYSGLMAIERINDNDSHRLVAKLQSFLEWWAPDWFPPPTDFDCSPGLPPALEWAVRFPPDFFSIGEFIAKVDESGELQCLQSYGEPCDGFIRNGADNPVVRFEAGDVTFTPTLLNDVVVGTVLIWCLDATTDDHRLRSDGIGTICTESNVLWDGSFLDGPLRAWLFGDELVIDTAFYGITGIRRPTPS